MLREEKVECVSCLSAIPAYHDGIKCTKGHNLCPDECSKAFIDHIFANAKTSGELPLICPMCKDPIKMESFVALLDEEQNILYIKFMTQILNEGDEEERNKLMTCAFCTYFELWE